MSKMTRAQFIGLGGVLAGGALGCSRSPEAEAQVTSGQSGTAPDLVVLNARVYTIDNAQPRAEAFAIKDSKFVAIGATSDIKNLVTRRTQIIDAEHMTVTPGFIDAHCHPSGINELYDVNANVRTVKELQRALLEKAAATPPGYWVSAFMFDDTKLDIPLHRKHLDEVVPNHPVAVNHRGGHTSWYNSKALELASITRQTRDPEHGRFFRDDAGELNGRVAELARRVFANVGKREQFTSEQSRERGKNGMTHISELLTAAGLTTVHDAGTGRERVLAYEDAYRAGGLRHRAFMMIRGNDIVSGLKAAGVYTGFGNEWIKVGGLKYAADGSASERTMRMSTPYVGTNDYGILTMTQQELDEAVEDGHRHNFQIGVHANGDVTIDMVLKAYEKVLHKWPDPDRRHRIEHCTLVNPDLLKRIKACGCIPTPFWTYVYYHGEKWSQYGDDKLRWMFAHRSFLDSGIPVPGASDYPPGPFEPLMAIQSMVTRRDYRGREWGSNQKVTVDEALRIATINGAYASSDEAIKGSITAGKLADFVILEKDPHDVDPNEIKGIRVARTVVGGKTMYPKSAA
jgi:predicted amidohydrolase YtcJ